MAYAKPRSVNAELHQGVNEGGYDVRGKDWGGVPGGVDRHNCGCPVGCDCGCATGDCHCDH
jgi:hypothetical protein